MQLKTLTAYSAIAAAVGVMAFAALPATAVASAPASASATSAAAVDAQFRAIAEEEYAWRQKEMPSRASKPSNLPDVSAATQQRRLAYWTDIQNRLNAISLDQLSPSERTNYAVYRHQIDNYVDDGRHRLYEMPFNSDSSFWSSISGMANQTFTSVEDYERYLSQLRDTPRYFDQQIVNMRAGLARGFTQPKASLVGRDVSILAVTEPTSPQANPLYKPFIDMPPGISETDRRRLRASAVQVIQQQVVPAHRTLLSFIRDEYVPGARDTLGANRLPNGDDFYQTQIRQYTSVNLTPDQIHQIGRAEVARIRAEMEAVMRSTGYTGDFAQFITFLKTDPQFQYEKPEHLLWHGAWVIKKVDGKMGQYFNLKPRDTFSLVPVPDAIAPFYTAGRGGNGTCLLNTYDLPSRPRYNIPALTVHECNPGHAWHGVLRREHAKLPEWRSQAGISAFGEGWALYTEKLAVEMGIYEDAYEDFGRLNYEMWRAARLVIDTGLHSKGWTRDQAIAFLSENTALSDHEVGTEIDRYITWPGQALAYKLGEIEIVRLRRQAEAELGADFDIKAFHDHLLALGVATIPAMTAEMEAFIAESKQAAAARRAE
ncbi:MULTISPECIES: DUF885 domain-containing protein [Brevundimonas]|uniref:DUF885 domain-containing protein n=1 Tax=Brevundimonas TaxID=41275 RepID=UPI001F47EBA2|nr:MULTISPECIES: DUF885 family protein [Brevundimonas]MDA0742478.1 DUF885 family protein [Pseudomonadota bacterium]MDM8351928.1 DUF885 family protein [Brevundimonas diminuta]